MSRYVFACVLATALSASAFGGCCSVRASRAAPIRDRLSTYVLVGIGAPPKCCLPPDQRRLYEAARGEATIVWLRSVFHDHIRAPIAGITVNLDVVDEFGDVTSDASVAPLSTVTTSTGFAREPVRFEAKNIGTFRIRAAYPDRRAISVSLSPTIVVVR